MEKTLFQIQAELIKIETKTNRSVRIIFDSQENLMSKEIENLMECFEKTGWLSFLVSQSNEQISPLDVVNLPEIKHEEDIKSPSQRLRAVLYILYQRKGLPGTFENYYRSVMEKLIEHYKEKLI